VCVINTAMDAVKLGWSGETKDVRALDTDDGIRNTTGKKGEERVAVPFTDLNDKLSHPVTNVGHTYVIHELSEGTHWIAGAMPQGMIAGRSMNVPIIAPYEIAALKAAGDLPADKFSKEVHYPQSMHLAYTDFGVKPFTLKAHAIVPQEFSKRFAWKTEKLPKSARVEAAKSKGARKADNDLNTATLAKSPVMVQRLQTVGGSIRVDMEWVKSYGWQ